MPNMQQVHGTTVELVTIPQADGQSVSVLVFTDNYSRRKTVLTLPTR